MFINDGKVGEEIEETEAKSQESLQNSSTGKGSSSPDFFKDPQPSLDGPPPNNAVQQVQCSQTILENKILQMRKEGMELKEIIEVLFPMSGKENSE
jgi:hypothetical protein